VDIQLSHLENAVATELHRARNGLESYELRGTPSEFIARAVKSAAVSNEQLEISRALIVAAEYRILDLQELKRGMERKGT
jgi:hypothetical protein